MVHFIVVGPVNVVQVLGLILDSHVFDRKWDIHVVG
jgi:hypothetical protein